MKLSDAEVRELFQRKTARGDASTCPNRDMLIGAARGALAEADRDAVAGHLAGCSGCAREFRIARELAPLEPAIRRELTPQRRTAWLPIAAAIALAISIPAWIGFIFQQRRDQATIDQLLQMPGERASGSSGPREKGTASPNRPLTRGPEDLVARSPVEVDVPIVDLDTDVTRGTSASIPTITVPRSMFTLILHLPEETSAPLDIEILESETIIATDHISGGAPRSQLTLALHRGTIGEGEHAVRIRWRGKQSTFRFRVDYP